MDVSLAGWLVLAVAIAAANLPFANERLFGFIPLPKGRGVADASSSSSSPADPARTKSFFARLLELLVLYFIVGALAWLLESSIGNVFAQGWEFYAITGCLFLVLAFPGFVLRYLRKRR
ncbi:MAG: DUF2818 family protein [Pseudomonadota bacterium]